MSDSQKQVLDHLPVFPDVAPEGEWGRLVVQGLVDEPLELTQEDLTTLAQQGVAQDFHCVEGWVVPDQKWEGVPVSALVNLAKPLPESKFLSFSAGNYTVGMSLDEAKDSNVIIALRLNGETLPREHGGPCRLIAAAKDCHFSVKWLDRIDISETPAEDTGLPIVQARASAGSARAS